MTDPQVPIFEQHIPIARAIDYRFAGPAAQRPGLVTAIGIMSIIVAGLAMFANFGMGMHALVMVAVSRMPPAPAAVPTPAPAPVPVTGPAVTGPEIAGGSSDANLSGRGYSGATRATVIAALAELEPLSEPRRGNLDALLEKAGKDVFPFDDRDVTSERIRAAVTEHGRKPFGTNANYFILGNGRLEVDDAEAIFTPWSGGDPVSTGAAAGQNGATVIGGAAPPAPGVNPFAGISRTAASLALIDAILSEGLAVFLLICGILVLRNSPRGARMHWIYVGLKLPLVIFTALAWGWLYDSMLRGIGNTVPGAAGSAFGVVGTIYAIVFAVMAAAYPFALLFALRARSVREYYSYPVPAASSAV